MNIRRAVTVALILLVAGSLAAALSGGMPGRGLGGRVKSPAVRRGSEGAVGLVRIEGPISAGAGQDSLAGGSAAGSDSLMAQLRKAREDGRIKVLVVRINSPGGTAAASQEIAGEIAKIREEGKKVIVSMGDVAASGGYWIASGADHIFANPGTQTGSIGVIMQIPQAEELMRKVGVRFQTIKSGPHKDIGSPDRDLTGDELGILQGIVDDIYSQFVEVVAKGRRLPEPRVRELADGRIFSGRQAKDFGLVDSLGNLQDALDYAAEQANLGAGYEVVPLQKTGPLERFLSGLVSAPEGIWRQQLYRRFSQELIGIDLEVER